MTVRFKPEVFFKASRGNITSDAQISRRYAGGAQIVAPVTSSHLYCASRARREQQKESREETHDVRRRATRARALWWKRVRGCAGSRNGKGCWRRRSACGGQPASNGPSTPRVCNLSGRLLVDGWPYGFEGVPAKCPVTQNDFDTRIPRQFNLDELRVMAASQTYPGQAERELLGAGTSEGLWKRSISKTMRVAAERQRCWFATLEMRGVIPLDSNQPPHRGPSPSRPLYAPF